MRDPSVLVGAAINISDTSHHDPPRGPPVGGAGADVASFVAVWYYHAG